MPIKIRLRRMELSNLETQATDKLGQVQSAQPSRRRRLPEWMKISLKGSARRSRVRTVLRELGLNSVCEAADCPNLCECWREGTATFMILGDCCTRNCAFCAVEHGPVNEPDLDECHRVAAAAARLNLRHVVITSVTRDDLPDRGAGAFEATVTALRQRLPEATLEVLIPDFGGSQALIRRVLRAGPQVLNHNIETCRRLTRELRDGADYDRSLAVLATAAEWGRREQGPVVKSGFMLGIGETDAEVVATMADLAAAGVTSLTIGQYLCPSESHWPVARYVPPEEFAKWGKIAHECHGFSRVACGPHVRSSYHAADGLA